MPRVIETTVYKFDELSEEAQAKALESLYDINVNDNWHESTYEDAETIGLKINSFDIDRGNYIKGDYDGLNPVECANNIIENHGEACETYKLAKTYLEQVELTKAKFEYSDKDYGEYEYDLEAELEDLAKEFKDALLQEYLSMLKKEYEYQTSEEAIKDSIITNEYEFTIEGKKV